MDPSVVPFYDLLMCLTSQNKHYAVLCVFVKNKFY